MISTRSANLTSPSFGKDCSGFLTALLGGRRSGGGGRSAVDPAEEGEVAEEAAASAATEVAEDENMADSFPFSGSANVTLPLGLTRSGCLIALFAGTFPFPGFELTAR